MGEIMHWAGRSRLSKRWDYADYYNDVALAAAGNRLGFVMSIDQYMETYEEWVKKDRARFNGSDFSYSKLGHGAIDNACLGPVNRLTPQYAKPK
jgi:hypothetical protein